MQHRQPAAAKRSRSDSAPWRRHGSGPPSSASFLRQNGAIARRRLTVSCLLSGRVAHEIDGLRRALGAPGLARIAPHVTLVPPVNVREEDLGDAVRVVRAAASSCGPIRLLLGPPATFFPDAPVVYLAIGGDTETLKGLRARLEAPPLLPPPGRPCRPFVPHVTLDQSISPALIPHALEVLAHFRAEVTLERLTVLEFSEAERRWKPMADADFHRPHVAGRGGLEVEIAVSTVLDPEAQDFIERAWEEYEEVAYGERKGARSFAITARADGVLIGAVTGSLQGNEPAYLAYLVVSPSWRMLGVGSQLLRAAERLAHDAGAPMLQLLTRSFGPARPFYERHGYLPLARLPRWRFGQDFDLLGKNL